MFENYEKRNEDFYKVVTEMQRKGSPGRRRASVGYAIRKALQSEAPSFYLSREHVWRQLHRRKRHMPPTEKPHRRAMWNEIERALDQRLSERKDEEPWVALDYVLAHHRPSRFFISEAYAIKLVMRLEREQKTTNGKKR